MTHVREPIAVIGLGCRFPSGIDSPESYWAFLADRCEAVRDMPRERRDRYGEPVGASRPRGSYLDDIAGFDAGFFGISPREARLMDPQQRLALEVSWEALEHAGVPPHSLGRTDTGVFMGVCQGDYGRLLLADLSRIEPWTGIGASYCGVANRVSHFLDLRGPSITVDTACSASLAAVHRACQSLWLDEIPLALAGGVMLMAGPAYDIALEAAGATSPDGRCKAFDAACDGYGRGEGCGVVVLERLGDALRSGHRVLAVVTGGAVHHDGRTEGIMAPSRTAQEHLLRSACRSAGIDPADIDYVEAHGTGTPAGDPVEAGALAAVLGAGRPPGRPCLIGSVKTNIGHLEAAAGVAGLIKTVLALGRGLIPATLTTAGPRPDIPWNRCGLALVTEHTDWPDAPRRPRRAGVAAYGYGGTIAHLVVQEAPAQHNGGREGGTVPAAAEHRPRPYPLSGADEAALRANAARLADWLRDADGRGPHGPGPHHADLTRVGRTLACHRSHLPVRAVVIAKDRAGLVRELTALAADPGGGRGPTATAPVTVLSERNPEAGAPDPVWVFSGHGAQWPGMGRDLLEHEPAFAATLHRLDPVFREEIGFAPSEALGEDRLGSVDRVQALTYALHLGLARVWNAYGVRPAAVLGHSVGEIAAAVVAGVLDEVSGARLACRRSRLLRPAAGRGAMALIGLSYDETAARLAGVDGVTAAVHAAPHATVVSGDAEAVARLAARCSAEGLPVRTVASDVAFHSPHMEPLCPVLTDAVRDLTFAPARLPLYSTALPDPRDTSPRDGAYWAANLRSPVRFAPAVTAAAEDGHRLYLEISAHPIVAHSLEETLRAHEEADAADTGHRTFVAHSLRRGRDGRRSLLENLAALHCHGAAVDWAAVHPTGAVADLPRYAWQRRAHWFDTGGLPAGRQEHDRATCTLLGGRATVHGTSRTHVWRTRLRHETRPYPGEHAVHGTEIVPAAVLLHTFFAAARAAADGGAAGGDGAADGDGGTAAAWDLSGVELLVPLVTASPREVQITHQSGFLRLSSRTADGTRTAREGDEWLTHTTAHTTVHTTTHTTASPEAEPEPEAVTGADAETPVPPERVVERLASLGVASLGFPWTVTGLRVGPASLTARVVTVPDGADGDPAHLTWASALDAAFSLPVLLLAGPAVLRMPARVDRARLLTRPPARALVRVRMTDAETADVDIDVDDGTVLGGDVDGARAAARLRGVRFAELEPEDDGGTSGRPASRLSLAEVVWRPLRITAAPGRPQETAAPRTVVQVGGDRLLAELLAPRLARAGVAFGTTGALGPAGTAADVVIVAPACDGPVSARGVYDAARHGACLLADTARRLAEARPAGPPRLWCVTRGARTARGTDALAQSALWGLGRSVAGEFPGLWAGAVDLPHAPEERDADMLLRLLSGGRQDADVIAVDGGRATAARLAPAPAAASGTPGARRGTGTGPVCRADGTYLITGGLGALGLRVARWLADTGARRLLLLGRTPLPPRTKWDTRHDPATARRIAAVRGLEALGVSVHTVAVDLADPARTAFLADPDVLGLPPVRGVVHAAGTFRQSFAHTLDEASLDAVLRPKVAGALVLHELFPPGSVDFFVLFSSAGQLLRLPGQASYAAANAFLDGLARHRRSTGHDDTVSLAWTSWRGLGMSAGARAVEAELLERGTTGITAADALRAWRNADRTAAGHYAVLRLTVPAGGSAARPPLLRDLGDTYDAPGTAHGRTPRTPGPSPEPHWSRLRGEELREALVGEVRAAAARALGSAPNAVDPHRPLPELGVDSLLTVRLRRDLEQRLAVALPATLLWNRPTVAGIAEHLARLTPAHDTAQSAPGATT
ncbi:phthiocerol synthesis polyketide synthase type I PpsA [Streptomyces fumigatiscleroticus]|nr:phthiocerol synthesis polyketide synthase type I PpsA [Streptomyces fumigatiscleroticus]